MLYETEQTNPSLLRDEMRLIPAWSMVVAIVLFAFAQYFSFVLMPQHHVSHAPLFMRMFWSISWGVVLGVYALLIGYISRDAQRRRMNSGLWMLAAILMPGAIGTVVYFLLRQPLVSQCPACNSFIEAGDNFCAQCRYQAALACGNCYRSVRSTEVFCTRCGHELSTDAAPRRLRELAQ